MKVNLPKDYKLYFTISDWEKAKEVIECEKGDDNSGMVYERIAIEHALKDSYECLVRIIESRAEVQPNNRIDGAYGDTGSMDVWFNITARTDKGYLEVGAYLTDIWNIGSDTDVRRHMWIEHYRRHVD